MRNLENIDLETLDHVTGGCGGSSSQAQTQSASTAQHQSNVTTMAGVLVSADKSDYSAPSLRDFTSYAAAADSDDGTQDGVPTMEAEVQDASADHDRFETQGHLAETTADDAADSETAASTHHAGASAWGEVHEALGYPVTDDADQGRFGIQGHLQEETTADRAGAIAWGETHEALSYPVTDDSDGTNSQVCGVTQGDDGSSMQHGALGSFHEVDPGTSTAVTFDGGQLDLANHSQASTTDGDHRAGFSLDSDHVDASVDASTSAGDLHVGYNGGQFGVTLR